MSGCLNVWCLHVRSNILMFSCFCCFTFLRLTSLCCCLWHHILHQQLCHPLQWIPPPGPTCDWIFTWCAWETTIVVFSIMCILRDYYSYCMLPCPQALHDWSVVPMWQNLESLARGLHQPCTRSYLCGGLCGCRSTKPCPDSDYCLWVGRSAQIKQNIDIRKLHACQRMSRNNWCDFIQSVSSKPRGSADDLGLSGFARGWKTSWHPRKTPGHARSLQRITSTCMWTYILGEIEE